MMIEARLLLSESQRSELPAAGAPSALEAEPTAEVAPEHLIADTRARVRRLVTVCFSVTMALCFALLACKTVAMFAAGTPWDDAFMFQRYAHNVVTDHRIAWNPNGTPTYGLTSLAFLSVSVLVYLLTGGNVTLGVMLQSFLCGIAFLVLTVALVWRAAGEGRAAKLACFVLVAFCLAGSRLAEHFVSGMDTAFGLTCFTVYLLTAIRTLKSPSTNGAVLLGALGGLAFSVRPELTVYSVTVPLALVILQRDRTLRRFGLVALGSTIGVLGGYFAFTTLCLGTPLPLPFYAKSTNLYGPGFLRAYRGKPTIDLLDWLESFWPFAVVVVLDVVVGFGGWTERSSSRRARSVSGPRAFWESTSALDRGVLIATLVCFGYAWLFVVPIMGFAQRFYYAPLPGVIYLVCRSNARLIQAFGALLGRVEPLTACLAVVAVSVHLGHCLASPLSTAGKGLATAIAERRLGHFDTGWLAGTSGPQKYWFGLPSVAALPSDLVIAATEVGFLSAVNLDKVVIDMAGLHDPEYALQPFSADRLLRVQKPDLIYMPHPDYVQMTEDLEKHPEMSRYVVYSKAQLQTNLFGIAIRRDSPHFAALEAIVKQKLAPPARPRK